jgi:hypothetical protein
MLAQRPGVARMDQLTIGPEVSLPHGPSVAKSGDAARLGRAPLRQEKLDLLGPQGFGGVDSGGAAGGDVAG